ncbi:MAG: hypothetical protein M3P26_08020 [Gemmatimonadota bacterium]|nr:hypothetical protein [Gemmatimonadota bacterium]
MRTFSAAVSGFLVASALMLAGEWAYSLAAKSPLRGESYATTFPAIIIALLYTGAAVILGAYVVAKMQDRSEAFTGFLVIQAFFGFGLIREFWSSSSSWYSATAMLLIIPGAIIGRMLAWRLGQNKMVGAA